jgi:hypothetical protein
LVLSAGRVEQIVDAVNRLEQMPAISILTEQLIS